MVPEGLIGTIRALNVQGPDPCYTEEVDLVQLGPKIYEVLILVLMAYQWIECSRAQGFEWFERLRVVSKVHVQGKQKVQGLLFE